MVPINDDTGELPDLSNRELLRLLSQEIVDTHRELQGDIQNLDKKLSKRIDELDERLSGKIHSVQTEMRSLRSEVHQNQVAFMANHDALEKRVTKLEVAV
jgi:SMC interacting uncharacterized protein involved in chromosome segregation